MEAAAKDKKRSKLFNKVKQYGPIAVFMFFLIKGLAWLIVPTLLVYFS